MLVTHDTFPLDTLAIGVTLQPDGKILVAGQINGTFGILRLTTNGALDSTFGQQGIATNSAINNFAFGGGSMAVGVAVQSTGKILAGVSTILSDGPAAFILARFDANGTVDTSFGGNGLIVTQLPGGRPASPNALRMQPDGKVLLAGSGTLIRYTADGELDSTFGTDGIAALPYPSLSALALQPNGAILIAQGGELAGNLPGSFVRLGPATMTGSIARLTADGAPDPSFGILGQAATLVSPSAIAVQSDGRIIVSGSAVELTQTTTAFGLIRYNQNGSIDTTFGSEGEAITDFGRNTAAVDFALAIQANGDLVAGGWTTSPAIPSQASFALARYTPAGSLDSTFGNHGTVTTNLGANTIASIAALIIQSNGSIVVAGNAGSAQQPGMIVNNIEMARYLP